MDVKFYNEFDVTCQRVIAKVNQEENRFFMKLKLLLILTFIQSCGVSEESSAPKINDQAITSTRLYTQDAFSKPEGFHNQGLGMKNLGSWVGSHYLSLSQTNEKITASHILHLKNSDTLELVILRDKLIFDFELFENFFLTIEQGHDGDYSVNAYDYTGSPLSTSKLPHLANEVCFDDIRMLGVCGKNQSSNSKPYKYYRPYKSAQIRASKVNPSAFYILADTANRYSTNLFKGKYINKKIIIEKGVQALVNINSQQGIPGALISGSELFTMNRFGRAQQKVFVVSAEDDLFVATKYATNYYLRKAYPSLSNTKDSRILVTSLYSSSLDVSWRSQINEMFDEKVDYLTGGFITKDSVYLGLTTSIKNRDKQFDINILNLNIKSGQLVKKRKINISHSDFLTSLTMRDNRIVLTGITSIKHNPEGLSFGSTGAMFYQERNLDLELLDETFWKFSERKDILVGTYSHKDYLYLMIDSNGPITHTGDSNYMLNTQESGVYTINFAN